MPAPAWLTRLPIAHRGLHGPGVPENSLAAFKAAADAGYAIELDVRLSADGEAIVFHDMLLDRMTGTTGTLSDWTADDLTALALIGGSERIPRLGTVLKALAGRVPLLIELKTAGTPFPIGRLERRVRDLLSGYDGPAAVQSFHPRTVGWFAAHAPETPRGFLSLDYRTAPEEGPLPAWARFLLRTGLAALPFRPHFIGYEAQALTTAPPRIWRRLGYPVLAWTLRSADETLRAAPHCDGVIFEGFRPPMDDA